MNNALPSLTPPGDRRPSDWLRYFPFESSSWRKLIADSELSADAKRVVKSVVLRSRLMRFEKLEVVNELLEHFTDGKMAGHSYSQLVAEFGDPDVTAKLIRRSKIRNRPIMFKALSIFGWGLLALVSVYASFAAYFHMGTPQPSIDYLADYNNGVEQAEQEDLAWPIYRPLWKKHGFSEGGGFRIDELYNCEDDYGVTIYKELKRPTDEGWDAAVSRLEELSDLLDGFRQARFKPRLGVALHADKTRYSKEDFEVIFPGRDYEKQESNSLFDDEFIDADVQEIMNASALNILLPHVQPLRTAARIFTVDTRRAIEQGDGDRVVANLEAILGVGRHAADSNTLVSSLVGFAVGGIGFNLMEEVLTEHPDFLTDEQLAQLQTAFEREDISNWITFKGERAFILDAIQRVYTDDGNGEGRITATGVKVMHYLTNQYISNSAIPEEEAKYMKAAVYVAAPASLFVVAGRKETTELAERFLDEHEELVDRYYWIDNGDDLQIEEFLNANQKRHFVLASLMPAFQSVRHALVRTLARQEATIAAIASQRHFLKYETWPDSFEQLSPEFVAEFPVDQMNGQFLKFKATENGMLIYSVGLDLDDDGGRMNLTGRPNFAPHHLIGGVGGWNQNVHGDFDADWILWPQLDWESRLPSDTEEE